MLTIRLFFAQFMVCLKTCQLVVIMLIVLNRREKELLTIVKIAIVIITTNELFNENNKNKDICKMG